jgi:hypothetical protein
MRGRARALASRLVEEGDSRKAAVEVLDRLLRCFWKRN